ncbi:MULTISPECIES: MFS transporter [Aminobacter]|jgi:predicted MFS family arabinose efflux permease|uniref:MFS family arabinose efflux permease n=2 Tax=Aminobacter TaxID=31988 RepID=A0AAC8YRQ4_AMIAI|nr:MULTISPECIES: MFS transporter [Aminobacter]AMS42969.1 MFS transporter [Aminobacter aminovorans]MBA8909445.1 putative MFS family arabinose efflux permease [Aminobacter ciceronei]MBA9023240.1 putative MFS family arabinose efflux permease [Aminobacter ciceronei]MBB3704820.1 putative MFS family arabinose efflux permease [Aminobacter aminovorans]MRX34288.1 MFS transporter [Aminobacter sp. MDW-2]
MTGGEREARRTAYILAASQAIIGSAAPISFAIGGLAGYYLLDADKSLATLPITGFSLGLAIGALPAAAIIRRIGQRSGFMFGTAVTAIGGAVATLALFRAEFWLFVFGLVLLGAGGAFVQQFRFAAADNAPPQFKANAISFVLAGGIITAIIGPQIVIFTRELFAPVMFAGSFASIIGLAAVGAIILSFLRVKEPVHDHQAASEAGARPLKEIVTEPRFAAALTCAVGSYTLMSFVMTGAPLAMVGCGFSPDEATLGISWHVMAMFGPSFFTGRVIQRFGAERVVAFGLLLLIACAIVALSGIALWQFWTALILLGLGWNFGFIGATAIVSTAYRPSEKSKVQGFHDFVLFGAVAFASLMSGAVYNAYGWDTLNWIVFPVSAICLAALATLSLAQRRQPT